MFYNILNLSSCSRYWRTFLPGCWWVWRPPSSRFAEEAWVTRFTRRPSEQKCRAKVLCADSLLRKLVHVDSAGSNCGVRGDIQISSGGLVPSVSISCRDCYRHFFYQSTPSMEIDTMCPNCPVDASALSFVSSFLTIGICYYGFLKLCEAAFSNAAFSARIYDWHLQGYMILQGYIIFDWRYE